MDKGHCPQHLHLRISVPACLVRLDCHSLSWCHYSCDLWPVAGWLSAKGDEISLPCHPSLCLGNSCIPQRGLSHWCCVSSAAAGFRSAWHLHDGGGNSAGVSCWWCHGPQQVADGWLSPHRITCFLPVFLTTTWTLKFTSAWCHWDTTLERECLAVALAVGFLEGLLCPWARVSMSYTWHRALWPPWFPYKRGSPSMGYLHSPRHSVFSVSLPFCAGRKYWCWLTDLVCSLGRDSSCSLVGRTRVYYFCVQSSIACSCGQELSGQRKFNLLMCFCVVQSSWGAVDWPNGWLTEDIPV